MTDDEFMMEKLRIIEAKIGFIEQRLDEIEQSEVRRLSIGVRHRAELSSLKSLLGELSVLSGVSSLKFQKVFGQHYLWQLESLFQKAEIRNKMAPDLIDDRTQDEQWTGDSVPTLLDGSR